MTSKEKELLKECQDLLKKNPKIKKRKLTKIKDLEKRLYYIKVWCVTEKQPLYKLPNFKKRCFRGYECFHLDHILSISYGFLNKIPPEQIGHISNLRFIRSIRNMRKGNKLTTEGHKSLRRIKRRLKF